MERAMATNRNFANFRAVYDDLTGEVERSSEQFLPDHLGNWFELIDETPDVRQIAAKLERDVFMQFIGWPKKYKGAIPTSDDTEFRWPLDRPKRLGMQLAMFREVSKRNLEARVLGERGIAGTSPDRAVRELIEHVFSPMSRDLRRLLEKDLADKPEEIPAADRVVGLDHNSQPYIETMEAAEEVEKAIQQANDFADQEEKEQRIAEVSAVRRLLQAVRVRVEPVAVLLKPLAGLAKTKLKDTVVGIAINKLLALIGVLIEYIWSAL